MAYIDFPNTQEGMRRRRDFWMSEDGVTLICQWRREGITVDEIAQKYIGIGTTTMQRWLKKSDELATALGVTKDVVNGKVEAALLQRALGYEYDEVTEELVEGQMRTTKVVRKHVSPDVKACLSWLFSRRPDRWRAQQAPLDDDAEDMKTARKILVAIKEVADGNPGDPESETG